ncbi:17366_t:CDS:10 [Entrophospora sp. SA101]|nr:17366_t:CDS:10 [Entrophospora sp. SA101]
MSNPKFPSNCPMHNEKPDGTTKNDNKSSCPITHSGDALSPENQIPTNLGHLPAPGQQIPLPTHRLTSSIPKAYSAEYWEYPSPQQFYNALVRKGWETPEDSVETMVDIHNFLNEAAWNEILKWESTKKCKCGDPKLLRFRGRPHELSPKARMLQWAGKIFSFMGTPPPFDRHDWTIDRCGKEVRYVIDYYSGPDEGDTPIFYLDVRPALDSIENNKEKQKLNNLRKTFQPLNKLRKRELRKFIQNTNTYQYNNNSSVNNKSASISTSPSHFTQPITYYGKSIKSRIPTTDLASLKKELQSINSSSLIKRRNFGTLFNEVEGDREEIELSMKEIREGFSKRDESIMDMEPRRSINLKPLKSGSSGSNTSRVSSSHTQRSNSPSMHKSMMVKEKLSKKKKSNNKQKNNDSDTDDLYIPPGHHRKEITKSGSLHKKKKIKKEFSDDDSDSSDFGKNHIKNSRQSTPVRTTNSGSVNETPVVKTKDQIPIKTFYEYVDPYVRELKQEDLDFLSSKCDEFIGPISQRLVMSLIDYGDNFNQQEGRHYLQTNGQNDFDTQDCNVNDRVLRELKALGLVDDDDVSAQWNGREDDEDDEIGRELRELQAKLHELERKNAYRKAVLRGRVKDLMGYQQYLHFETEVNNEIEETYLARFPDKQRGIKRGRNGARKTIPGDDEVRKQIERRNELSKLIGNKWSNPEKFKVPTESIFNDEDMKNFVYEPDEPTDDFF